MISENTVQSQSKRASPVRVLMADPDEAIHSIYKDPLSNAGFEANAALSGLDCLIWLRDHIPDLVVLEPQLPWGGGEGVLAIMSESLDLAAVPVMILTSCRDSDILERISNFPVHDYDVKPLLPDQLIGRLRALLNDRGIHDAAPEQNRRLESLIARRTNNRVRNLRVDIADGRVMVCGCAESHYVKQLALAAVMESIKSADAPTERIAMEIEVCGDCQSTVPELCFEAKGNRDFIRWDGKNK